LCERRPEALERLGRIGEQARAQLVPDQQLGPHIRVQRWLGIALLERGDDGRRVADALAVELEHREGLVSPTREPERDEHVQPRHRRLAVVVDALVRQRPPHLLAVVRDADVPQGRRAVCRHRPGP
jgi:hypothetical protein